MHQSEHTDSLLSRVARATDSAAYELDREYRERLRQRLGILLHEHSRNPSAIEA
jgi:hypothetical protein